MNKRYSPLLVTVDTNTHRSGQATCYSGFITLYSSCFTYHSG